MTKFCRFNIIFNKKNSHDFIILINFNQLERVCLEECVREFVPNPQNEIEKRNFAK